MRIVEGELDEASAVPLYRQLQAMVRRQIQDGGLPAGASLPNELELAARYGVSRATVRQALADLVAEGLIVRKRGRGSFVSARHIDQVVTQLQGFTEALVTAGLEPQVRVLAVRRVPVRPPVAEQLGVAVGTPVVSFERLVRVAGDPLVLDSGWLAPTVPLELDAEHLGAQPLYRLAEAAAGHPIAGALQVITAVSASQRQAVLLEVRRGAPLLQVRRRALSPRGNPMLYGVGLFRADRYQYETWLKRSAH